MENGRLTETERTYAQRVYDQMTGLFEDQEVPGVRDESEDGFVGKYYNDYYEALDDLASRFAFSIEDYDVILMMDAMERLLLDTALQMFEYGAQWGVRKAAKK